MITAAVSLLCATAASAQERTQPYGWSAEYLVFDSLAVRLPQAREDEAPLETAFRFRNAGDKEVQIESIECSCNCVTYGLDKNILKPGESAEIWIRYIQRGHPGKHDRVIMVYEKGEEDPSAILTLRTDITLAYDKSASFPVEFGYYRLKSSEIRFKAGRQGEQRIGIANISGRVHAPVIVEGVLPRGISVKVEPEILLPGKEGEIIVNYDGRQSIQASEKPVPLIIEGTGLPSTESTVDIYFR